ncbi:ArfGap-domain-containing protein [Auriscalpium vulgare]|uniref:ArfGap-domain-containing protein n=1 Tax=Auriscalpium vulgare TaxID=40419 RepID=A0ACB8RJK8_9AGAM|nr:ArfGap-domain-containing protein [Auriscalpium vulgare]
MSRQDKATTDKNARTLRELVKRPENRVCSDCKHNDPRWASWNLGVFLCIRCSGIHRGMGTHISKVKSIDLDTWTPEQMDSIQKWGNRLANLYWEAHLKPGHIPPDHKMESFIRSKYESRRWAMDGPPPSDPAVLDNGGAAPSAPAPPPSSHAQSSSISASTRQAVPPVLTPPITTRQPQPHQLLSTQHLRGQQPAAARAAPALPPAPQAQTQAPPPAQPKAPENDLFSLDFHAPAVASPNGSASAAPKKDVKNDILSLFSTAAAQPAQPAFGAYAVPAQPQAQSPWGQPAPPAAPFSNANPQGAQPAAAWNVGQAWGQPAPAPAPAQSNVWGAPAAPLANTNDIWGSPAPAPGAGAGGNLWASSTPAAAPKKDDVFGDIWGGFK